nr:hypothetical protein [bacterium]
MKFKVYAMIEEYNEDSDTFTDDEDYSTKMNSVINQIQNELSRLKKLPEYKTMEVTDGKVITLDSIDNNIYQLNVIKDVDYEMIGDSILFKEDGTARIYYYKYPKQITQDTPDTYKFELSDDVLEIMPYGVAGDLLKSDVSNQYGQVYANRYEQLKSQLDPRYSLGSIYIDGGIDV